MRSFVFALLAVSLAVPISAAFANPRGVTVMSTVLGEGLQTVDKRGYYAELAETILSRMGSDNSFSVVPLRRMVVDLNSRRTTCVWSMDIGLLEDIGADTSNLVESETLFTARQYIFTRQNEHTLESLHALKGKSVAMLNGSNLSSRAVREGAIVSYVPTQEAKLGMLEMRHADAVVGWLPDILITASELGYNTPLYDPDGLLSTSRVNFVCDDGPEGTAFIALANKAIHQMKQDGTLEEINGRWGGFFF